MKTLCLPLAMLLATIAPAVIAAADGEEPEIIRVEFSALSLGEYLPDVCYESTGQVQKLAVNNGSRSVQRTYIGPPTLVFFTEHTTEDGSGNRQVLGSIDLRGRKGPLLLLFDKPTDAEAAAPMRIAALEDGPEAFPDGSYRLLNMTGQTVRASIDDRIVTLAPRSAGVAITPAKATGSDAPTLSVVMGRFDAQQAAWVRFYESKWPLAHKRRTLVLLYPLAKASEGIGVRRIAQMTEFPAELLPRAAALPMQ